MSEQQLTDARTNAEYWKGKAAGFARALKDSQDDCTSLRADKQDLIVENRRLRFRNNDLTHQVEVFEEIWNNPVTM